ESGHRNAAQTCLSALAVDRAAGREATNSSAAAAALSTSASVRRARISMKSWSTSLASGVGKYGFGLTTRGLQPVAAPAVPIVAAPAAPRKILRVMVILEVPQLPCRYRIEGRRRFEGRHGWRWLTANSLLAVSHLVARGVIRCRC